MTDTNQGTNEGTNEVVIRQADLKELESDLQYLDNLTVQAMAASDAVGDRASELAEKYKGHPTFARKAASFKKMSQIRVKDTLNSERDKANELFDLLEALMEKE